MRTKLDQTIARACVEYLAGQPPVRGVPDFVPSPALEARLDRDAERALPLPKRHAAPLAVRWAAAAAVILLLGAGLWTAAPGARAAILGWTRSMADIGNQRYTFAGEITGGELGKYEITALPEGFALCDEIADDGYYSASYINGEEEQLRLYCVAAQEKRAVSVEVTDAAYAEIVPVLVGALEGEFYDYSEKAPGRSNGLVWSSADGSVIFAVSGALGCDALRELAESVRPVS